MISRNRRPVWIAAALLACLVACTTVADSLGLGDVSAAPDSVIATARGMRLVQLAWARSAQASGYRIERRANLTGPFATIREIRTNSITSFTDDSVEPETVYGYRVVALNSTGQAAATSVAVVVRTPPLPGIAVATIVNTPGLSDPDGYSLAISRNGASITGTRFLNQDSRRFSPLPNGDYDLDLAGLAPNCGVDNGAHRTVTVVDTGVTTLQTVSFVVSCRDPNVGQVRIAVTTTGDTTDTDGYTLTLTGIASDTTLPDSVRAFFQRDSIGAQASRTFANLRPGQYTLTLGGVSSLCAAGGGNVVTFPVNKLDDLAKVFSVVCTAPVDSTKPLVWSSRWSAASAASGQRVSLDIGLDLSGKPGQDVGGAQALLLYDATVVRLDSAVAQSPWQGTFNTSTAGQVRWVVIVTSGGPTGVTTFVRFYFTAIGAAGTSATTNTTINNVADGAGSISLLGLIRKVEGTFMVSSGGSPGNQPPIARTGGPYAGTPGVAVAFSGGASSDPDGTILSYAWDFGDGGSATTATPTHAYGTAGVYTATLTVTDNGGASASSSATVTITAAGGNQPPVANAGGPYTGNTGAPIAFNGAASADPDGSIATYVWNFGDNTTASGVAPSHLYASAGTYTVTLTVTDNLGAQAGAQSSVTVSTGASPTPFSWQASFGAIDPITHVVALTITYDLSTDIPETPGPEALASWAVDSLKWDPAVLQYFSFNFGPGGFGSVNPTNAFSQGKLQFSGTQGAANSTGVMTIATIQFKVIGAAGSTTTTATSLGALIGTAATGSYGYRLKTTLQEGMLTAP